MLTQSNIQGVKMMMQQERQRTNTNKQVYTLIMLLPNCSKCSLAN